MNGYAGKILKLDLANSGIADIHTRAALGCRMPAAQRKFRASVFSPIPWAGLHEAIPAHGSRLR